MKKLIAFILCFVLVAVPFTMIASADGFQEEGIPYEVAYTIGAYTVKPVLDGKLDGAGAYTKIGYRSTEISYAWSDNVPNSEALAKGLEFELYASYDASNLYVLVVSDAKMYFNECDDEDGNAWQYSCIQVSVADADDYGGDRLEFGIWRKSNDGGQGGVIWAQNPNAKAEFTPVAGTNYVVALDGGKLYYEAVIPVNTFLGYDTVGEDDKIGLNFVISQADAANVGHIHTQYSSGCTGDPGKDAERFSKITLGRPIAVSAEVAVSDGIKLVGELIGSEMGWGENTLAGRAAAFDGDTSTYFDPTNANDPEDYVGIKVSEPYTLTEIRIHPRENQLPRFEGASIWGFNEDTFDPYGSAVQIWESDAEADEFVWQIITSDKFFVQGQAFTHYAYFNERQHGDVAEIELYGIPASGMPVETPAETPAAGEDTPAPAVDTPAPAPAEPPATSPTTGDADMIVILSLLIVAAAGAVVLKKQSAK
ncbi:MAG: CBM9 family sugar-binding protein [Oscillospiraceae bacterium]|nr:CBM9 family sugar-binding protein [Oscillospiraceae bacterium]